MNSYKRLQPGYEAPVYVTWAKRNHSDLIRIPEYQPGQLESARIEYRAADSACNPYLAFAVMLAAGLRGVERTYDLPQASVESVDRMTDAQRAERGIAMLPGSLGEAIDLFAASELMRETLGEHVFESVVANKRMEWDAYRAHVSDFEMRRYLPVL